MFENVFPPPKENNHEVLYLLEKKKRKKMCFPGSGVVSEVLEPLGGGALLKKMTLWG